MSMNVIYSCDQSRIFSIITPVFSVTWSFRNLSQNRIFSQHFTEKEFPWICERIYCHFWSI